MLADLALSVARDLVFPEVLKALRRDDVPVDNRDAPVVAEAIVREIAPQIAPQIIHKANAEPWYQSRVTWGALVSIGTGLAALAGVAVSPADAELIVGLGVAAGTAIGGAITLYGRWAAKKPIGQ